jgi:hypothetical protein
VRTANSVKMFIAATALAMPASAADPPGRLIDAPEAYTYGCTRAEAKPVTLRELQRQPAAYLRMCVRIEGISAVGREVYADVGDFYRHITQLIAGPVDGIGVGLYWSKRSSGQIGYRERVEIIGRAFSCTEVYREVKEAQDEKYAAAATPPPPPMLAGYCHYYGDAIVHVAEARTIDPGPLRLTGPEAAANFGDLDELRTTDERYSEVWKRATQWFDAVRRSGSPQYDDFIANHCGGAREPTTAERQAEIKCRANQHQRLAALGTGPLPPIRFYVRKTKSAYLPPENYMALGCVCRVATCEGLWPIHSIDADSSAWPYVCVHVEREAGTFKVH